jgi:hypothetical protein
MDLSEWFRIQLQSSGDAVVWAVGQVPDERREITPPPYFGEWSVAHHIFHLLYYEREAALPHMQHWFDESFDLTQTFTHYKEEETWKNNAHKLDAMLEEFQQVRTTEIALLTTFNGQSWQEIRPSGWRDQSMQWIVTKTLQHTTDHLNTILQMSLFWRPA